MNIQPITNRINYSTINRQEPLRRNALAKDTVSFKGHAQTEMTFKKGLNLLIHQTSFFREPETKEFVCDYLTQTFPKENLKIVSGGCSTGEEAVTMSMLLYPLRDKVEILGIDLGKKAIKQAQSRKYVLEGIKNETKIYDYFEDISKSPYSDSYLAFKGDCSGLTPVQQKYKALFKEFFEPTGEKVKTPIMELIHNFLAPSCKEEPLLIQRKAYKLKDGMAENCNFVQGDIQNIEQLNGDKKANAILFTNAIYHLITKDAASHIRVPKKDAEQIVENLINNFKNCLKNNGLVVFGENEGPQIGDSKIVPKVMKKLGFTPLNKTKKHEANVWILTNS